MAPLDEAEALVVIMTSSAESYCMCAAEADYLAFRLSIGKSVIDYTPVTKTRQEDFVDVVNSVRRLLRGRQACLSSDPRHAYRAVRRAVSVLRKPYGDNQKLSKPPHHQQHQQVPVQPITHMF